MNLYRLGEHTIKWYADDTDQDTQRNRSQWVNGYHKQDIAILTDSQAAITVMSSPIALK